MTRLCIQFIEINHVYCLFISKIFLKILSLNIGKLQHLYYDVWLIITQQHNSIVFIVV